MATLPLGTPASPSRPPHAALPLLAAAALLGAGPAAAQAAPTQLKALVVLVEFSGTDTFSYTAGSSFWDPYGVASTAESTGGLGDCSLIDTAHGLVAGTSYDFTYTGPLHGQLPAPPAPTTSAAGLIYTPDFSAAWYRSLIFGEGVVMDYAYGDGTPFHRDFTGLSLRRYLEEASQGQVTLGGDVLGWIDLPHSVTWYGGDYCPGAASGITSRSDGAIPGAGSPASLVQDVVARINALDPAFDWSRFDGDGDGEIDRLIIVHAGPGEEDGAYLPLTPAGEGTLWSTTGTVNYQASPTSAFRLRWFHLVPENVGLARLARAVLTDLGATDLTDHGVPQAEATSASPWTPMATLSTGFPAGAVPPALDPLHLDRLGWLDPLVVSDPAAPVLVRLGQASGAATAGARRAVKIELPPSSKPMPIAPRAGAFQWHGGDAHLANGMMTLAAPVAIPAGGAPELVFELAYDIEEGWDFLWVQASSDGGATWTTLTNPATTCAVASGWIGPLHGFPADPCAAGIGGFTGSNGLAWAEQRFDLSAFAGQSVLVRLWYMTDWATILAGPFVDDVRLVDGATTLFADGGEAGDAAWTYQVPWMRVGASTGTPLAYYLQWRNTGAGGGFDQAALGDAALPYGPAGGGLLVWLHDGGYTDNNLWDHLTDWPSFGPKGVMLVVDAHPQPRRDATQVASYPNELSNLPAWLQGRDAAFSVDESPGFTLAGSQYPALPASPLFSDARGWWPGAELVPGGPGSLSTPRWITADWDASVVLPATARYPMNAAGWTPADRLRVACQQSAAGSIACYGFVALPDELAGGTGNPSDAPGGPAQYGWNVRVVAADGTAGTVAIWNGPLALFPPGDQAGAAGGAVSLAVHGETLSGGALAWSATGLPAGLAIDPATGVISGTPAGGSVGSHVVTVTLEDPAAGLTDERTFTWTITPEPSSGCGCAASGGDPAGLVLLAGLALLVSRRAPRRGRAG